jgi:hypothetical protein
MATLQGVEIFQSGIWNGRQFGEGDLDGIVKSFDVLGLGGRIPLKLGHNAEHPLTDGQPALGWVERIWREGKTLMADFRDVPSVIYDAIKRGLYKFVSVELLRDVQADTRTIPLVLDAVALLGSDVPAVGTLRDLQSLTLSRLRGAERLTFTKTFLEVRTVNETDNLRRENERLRAALHRQTIDHAIESDVRARLVRPAAREQFARLFRLTDDASYSRITSNDWREFARSQPRPPSGPATLPTGEGTPHLAPDAALAERVRERIAQHFAVTQGRERLDFSTAAAAVVRETARTDPGLLRAWIDQPGEM